MKFLLAFSASAALIALTSSTTVDAIGLSADAGPLNFTASTSAVVGGTDVPTLEAGSAAGLRLHDDSAPQPTLAAIAAQ